MQKWRPIPSMPGYEASDIGHIRIGQYRAGGHVPGHVFAEQIKGSRVMYCNIVITISGAKHYLRVPRLVCEAFNGPAPPRHFACHKDGNSLNNHHLNLYWGTAKENEADKARHGKVACGSRNGAAKLREEQIPQIRHLLGKGVPKRDISRRYGVTEAAIYLIEKGIKWKHVQ